jgi:hypothetical protein
MYEILYTVAGTLGVLLVQVIAARFGWKIPTPSQPVAPPQSPASPPSDPATPASPASPLLPLPIGKGGLLMAALSLLLRMRSGAEQMEAQDREMVRLIRTALPSDEQDKK